MQVLDLHSTHVAEALGAVEANPLMRTSLSGRIALKAASTAAVIVCAERHERDHPRLVMWTLTALNSGCAVILTRNDLVQRRTEPGTQARPG